jgi:D-glycero-D-manno-heptose 1,7-bisphosphate phosphatase
MTPAVFLDRDGTIIEGVHYLSRLEDVVLFPWTVDALRLLHRAGFATVVVTNQSAVARGIITEEFVRETHALLDQRFAAGGARMDGYYVCPHHPEALLEPYRASCGCRKPAPGMLEKAAAERGLDLSRSWMIGDRWLDVQAGSAAGVRSILLRPDQAPCLVESAAPNVRADAILNNLMEAVGWILRASTSR